MAAEFFHVFRIVVYVSISCFILLLPISCVIHMVADDVLTQGRS